MTLADQVQQLQGLLTRERLAIDRCDGKRTTFLTHVGAQDKLQPGAWLGTRSLFEALAGANLSQAQRRSLATGIIVDYGQEVGVGRLVCHALRSGLPLGGAAVALAPRAGSPRVLYTWSLGAQGAQAWTCDWLLLRAEPGWALDEPARGLDAHGLQTLHELGAGVVVACRTGVDAHQLASAVGEGGPPLNAHPRFSPFLPRVASDAGITLWPHDALDAESLAKRAVSTVVLVDAPAAVARVARERYGGPGGVQVVDVRCPERAGRPEVEQFWQACGRPKILLRGDAAWSESGRAWLESMGATVATQPRANQLGLFASGE